MKTESCDGCANKGYRKENGDCVCKWGANFNYDTLRYDADYAKKCGEYKPQEPEAVF